MAKIVQVSILVSALIVVAADANKFTRFFKSPKMTGCIAQVVNEFEGKVPEVCMELEDLVREINIPLYELPLSKLLEHPEARIDLEEARVMTDQVLLQAGTCKKFQNSIADSIKRSQCGEDLLEMSNIHGAEYEEKVAKVYPEFDKLIGYKSVCSLITM